MFTLFTLQHERIAYTYDMAVRVIVVTPVYVAVERTDRMALVELVVRTHRPARLLGCEAIGQGIIQFTGCERREPALTDVILRLQA